MIIVGPVLITDHALTRFRERVSLGEVHNEKGIIRAMIDQGSDATFGELIDFDVKRLHDYIYLIAWYRGVRHGFIGKRRVQVLLILGDEGLGLTVVTVRTKGDRG